MNKQTTLVFMGLFAVALLIVVLLQLDMLPGLSTSQPESQQSVPILERAENASSVTDTINREPLENLPDLDTTPVSTPETPPVVPQANTGQQPANGQVSETDLTQPAGQTPATQEPATQPPAQGTDQMTQVADATPTPPVAPMPLDGPNQVSDVQLTSSGQGASIVITSLGAFERYKYFTLKEPGRLVVDLYGNYELSGSLGQLPDNAVVKAVRTGMHEGKLRIVFDLATEDDYTVDVVKLSDAVLEVTVAQP